MKEQRQLRNEIRSVQSTKTLRNAAGLLFVALATLTACGSDAPPGDDQPGAADQPLLPWAVGNTWTYRVTEDGAVSDKTTTVMEKTTVGGDGPLKDTEAYFVVTKKGADQKDKTESYQAPDPMEPDRVLRYRELSYGAMTGLLQLEEYWVPPRIHADGSQLSKQSWVDAYTEFKLPAGEQPSPGAETHDLWVVLSTDEAIDTPSGHFAHAVHLQKTGGSVKEYWYVRGVGKVRETGGQTEELVSYHLETSINALKK
jgi:hypothetical protein